MTTENEPAPHAAQTGGIAPSAEIAVAASPSEAQGRPRLALDPWLLLTSTFLGCIAFLVYGMVWLARGGPANIEIVMIMIAVNLGQISFMLLWTLLGDDRPVVRFGLLPVSLVVLSYLLLRTIIDPISYEIVFDLLKMVLLVSTPLLILRRNGWQITRTAPAPRAGGWKLRFSLADMLIGTTGLSIVLGLISFDGIVAYDICASLLFALPTVAATVLAFRGWLACAVVTIAGWTAGLYAVLLLTRFDEMDQLGLAIVGMNAIVATLVGILAATVVTECLIVRAMGYRLRNVGRASSPPAGA